RPLRTDARPPATPPADRVPTARPRKAGSARLRRCCRLRPRQGAAATSHGSKDRTMQPGYLLPAALAATLAFNAPAGAATIERTEIMMAVSACQSALPVFDGVIRKRPLA